MQVIRHPSPCPEGPSVVTIGAYDGVHLGHLALLGEVRRRAAQLGAASAVVTFDRHPATVVRPESAPRLLCDLDQKLELLERAGVDRTLVVRFDAERSRESAEDFVREVLVGCLSARAVVVGADFHFGHARRGNLKLLSAMGRELGFEVVGVSLVSRGSEPVSSTRIRRLVAAGEVEEAASLLGRDYEVRGQVVPGDRRAGAELGFPTANVAVPPEVLVPGDGIYAGWFEVPGQGCHPAAVYVGRRPTFYGADAPATLEAYLIGFSGDLYGDRARVRFVRRIRSDQAFGSAGELAAQMSRDIDAARAALFA
jgi:riboflavin kinase/FMN adenylyltransferase